MEFLIQGISDSENFSFREFLLPSMNFSSPPGREFFLPFMNFSFREFMIQGIYDSGNL